jgi:branched-chain amino acid transport system substrate-binding protein
LTGKACSPNGIQWNADNWSNGVALMRLLIAKGHDSFFFITADYAFGASVEADARDAILHAGGTVAGAVRSPLNTADFSSYLVDAQASKAKVMVFAVAGADLLNALKQASEFHLAPGAISCNHNHLSQRRQRGRTRRRPRPHIHAILVLGPQRSDARFRQALFARRQRMPNDNQVALYSSVRLYLEAVARAGTDDTQTVMKAMRAAPIRDVFTDNGAIRADGRVLYESVSDAGKIIGGVQVSVGLSHGRRENSGHRDVPPTGRGRMHAGRALGADIPTPRVQSLSCVWLCPYCDVDRRDPP